MTVIVDNKLSMIALNIEYVELKKYPALCYCCNKPISDFMHLPSYKKYYICGDCYINVLARFSHCTNATITNISGFLYCDDACEACQFQAFEYIRTWLI